jgi:hypothetical protein
MEPRNHALFVYLSNSYAGTGLNELPNAQGNCLRLMVLLDEHKWYRDLLGEARATRDAILLSLTEIIQRAEPETWLLFYFFGHALTDSRYGTKNHEGNVQSYLLTYNERLKYGIPYEEFDDLFLLDDQLTEMTRRALGKGLFVCNILDCCYGGGMISIDENTTESANHVFIAASQRDKTALLTTYETSKTTRFYSLFHPAASRAQTFGELRKQVAAGFGGLDKSEVPLFSVGRKLIKAPTVFKL